MPLSVHAQHLITGSYTDEPLRIIIAELEEKYDLVFSYTDNSIYEEKITVHLNHNSLSEALETLFEHTLIDFDQIDDSYIVLKSRLVESTLCGTIVDPEGNRLAGATVLSMRSLQGVVTNIKGIFKLHGYYLPTDSIEIRYIGFQPKITTAQHLMTCPEIQLIPSEFLFNEILIKEYIMPGIEQSEQFNHVALRPNAMRVVPGLTEADVLQMVQILPGVQSPDETASGLHIRGGTPDQNLILWDGIPIYNGGHFFGMLSAFNPYIVDEVKVYRGGFGAEYGGRVSGVIDISSTTHIPSSTTIDAGINFTHADLAVTAPLMDGKSSLSISARRAYTNILETPTYQKLSERVFQKGKINEQLNLSIEDDVDLNLDLEFVFNDLNAKWLFKPDEKNTFSISAFGIFDQLSFLSFNEDEQLSEQDNLDLNSSGFSTHWQRTWDDSFSSLLQLTYTALNNDHRFTVGFDDEETEEIDQIRTNNVKDWTGRMTNRWHWSEKHHLRFGYQFSDIMSRRQFQFQQDEALESIEDRASTHTIFSTLHYAPLKKWNFDLGGRLNYYDLLDRFYVEPRFSMMYHISDQWKLKGVGGVYYQFINQIVELNDLGFNEQLWALSTENDDFPPVRNISFSGGLLWNKNHLQIDLETYWKQLDGLTSESPVFVDALTDIYNVGQGEIWGIDALIKNRWSNYQTWLSYSYNQIQYTFDDLNLGDPFSAPHERPHSLTSVHLLDIGRWQLSASWAIASGKVFTEAEGVGLEDGEYFPIYPNNRLNRNRLPLYHRLDASILYRVSSKNGRSYWTFGLSALNVYNRRNLQSRQFSIDFDDEIQEETLIVLDRPLLGFTPNLLLRWSLN